MRITNSVSVVIPAYNEEKNIKAALENAISAIDKLVLKYEIIAIDDGSSDATDKILDRLAKKYRHVRVVHHRENRGFGYTIKEAIKLAKMEYITGLPGDNDTSPKLLSDLIKNSRKADLITAYMINTYDRSFFRRTISNIFVLVMNFIFGLNLRYYNSYFICKTKMFKKLTLRSMGFTIFAEAKVRLIKGGASFREIGFEHIQRKHGKSKAVSIGSFLNTLNMLAILFFDMYVKKDK